MGANLDAEIEILARELETDDKEPPIPERIKGLL
jgi:hypothetical protein